MIINAPADIAFSLFSIPIYWYGITMACAIFISMITGNFLYNKINPNLQKDIIIDYAPLIILLGILGARLYFCILQHDYYFDNPLEILDIRQGGLSIHGALIGGIIGIIIASKKTKVPMLNILDALSCTTILGQSIGRWGNYFNSEAYGLPVKSQNWGLFIPETKRFSQFADYSLFHPTFLYESLLDFIAFLVLTFILIKSGKKYRGITFFAYLAIYSVIRFFIEKIRIDSALNIGSVPFAEIISVVLFLIGISGILFIIRNYAPSFLSLCCHAKRKK